MSKNTFQILTAIADGEGLTRSDVVKLRDDAKLWVDNAETLIGRMRAIEGLASDISDRFDSLDGIGEVEGIQVPDNPEAFVGLAGAIQIIQEAEEAASQVRETAEELVAAWYDFDQSAETWRDDDDEEARNELSTLAEDVRGLIEDLTDFGVDVQGEW